MTNALAFPSFIKNYSHIIFLDSDAAINPNFFNRSLYNVLNDWSVKSKCNNIKKNQVERLETMNAAAIFLDNSPFVPFDKYLCDGVFILNLNFNRTSKEATSETSINFISKFLHEWWDFDIDNKNFNHAYEQDSLWDQLYGDSNSFRITSNHVCIIKEHQFPPNKNQSLWIMHVGSPWEKDRLIIFNSLIKELKINIIILWKFLIIFHNMLL